MTNTKTHAEKELDILIKTTPDAIIRYFIPEILALCHKFGESGQSGGSAPYTAGAISDAIKKLCLHQTIAPLTGEEDEWGEIFTDKDDDTVQNRRLFSVFKKDGRAYYLDAITWKTQTGSTWSGNAYTDKGEKITSRQYIKSFPFKAKDFVIDVIEKEVKKDDWLFTVKDEKDLEKVFEYYDKFTN